MTNPSRRSARSALTAWCFSGPYVALLFIFGLVPAAYAVYESFTASTQGGTGSLGIGNYTAVFHDFRFVPAVENVAVFAVIWIPAMIIGSLLFALLLQEKAGRLSSTLRLIYFLPGAVTGSAAVLLWYFMLDPQISPFGPALQAIGWGTGDQVFMNSHLALIFAVIAFATGAGNWIVIMFGALQAIPHDVVEAARVDGAGPLRTALLIKLPMISKYVVYMVILCFAAALQIFVEPTLFYSITKSGSDWWSVNQLGYSFAFQQGVFGQAATVSVILLLLSGAGALVFVLRSNFFETEVNA